MPTKLLVVAIDFGTTYSGYAFSLKHEFDKDPLDIKANTVWNAGGQCLMSLKTPTCLLVDPNKVNPKTKEKGMTYFGYEAQNVYMDLALDKKHRSVYYFSLFKMKLHGDKGVIGELILEDETGRQMKALDVFAHSIKWLKDHLMDSLKVQGVLVKPEEIQWVLTVPAIWSDSAKIFMRKAAEQAGIPSDDLKIALEPEAASLYCQHLPTERLVDASGTKFSVAEPGTKYMVVDLGGGTADITVHEKLKGGKLKELYKASGGACGGSNVNKELFKMFSKIVGGPTLHRFQKEHMWDYLDMFREFEVTKRNISPDQATTVQIKVPASMNTICQEINKESVFDIVKSDNFAFKGEISTVADKLRLSLSAAKKLFQPAVDEITGHIRDILSHSATKGVSTMLLVGGFSECPLVHRAIISEFKSSGIKIIVPQEAGLAVLKGAVIFGHQPRSIQSRITRFTYGVDLTPEFDPSKHPIHKKIPVCVNGKYRCRDVFGPFMTIGKSVEVGEKVLKAHTTIIPFQSEVKFAVYTSTSQSPKFIDDPGCQKIGELEVTIPEPKEAITVVVVQYIFGDTEIHMLAMAEGSSTPCITSFKLE